jgi:hypothetical protein
VRARLAAGGSQAELRDAATYRFGSDEELAVCGRLVPAGAPVGASATADLVARVLLTSGLRPEGAPRSGTGAGAGGGVTVRAGERRYLVVLEDAPGLRRGGAEGEAWRRYCVHAAAAPRAPAAGSAEPVSSAAAVAEEAIEAPPPPAAAPTADSPDDRPAVERVVLGAPANIRASPGGGAAVLRTAPRGTGFIVQGRAPGGWVRIGGDQGEPEGWVHSSLLQGGGR